MKLLPIFMFLFLFSLNNYSQEKSISFFIIDEVPVYPGCNGDNQELKKCFNKGIQRFFLKNFNIRLLTELLGSTKKVTKVYLSFKIDSKGFVKETRARAPYLKLKEESLRILALLPKMKPGKHEGKEISVSCSIPFTFVNPKKIKKKKITRKQR